MKSIFKIIYIISIICIILCIVFLFRKYTLNYKNGLRIQINNYNLMINMETIENNKNYNDETFTKIKLNFHNYSNYNINLPNFHYELVDADNYTIAFCNSSEYYGNRFNDILTTEVPKKSTIEGYLYCNTKENNFEKLKISVPKELKKLEDNTYEIEYEYYYINLK